MQGRKTQLCGSWLNCQSRGATHLGYRPFQLPQTDWSHCGSSKANLDRRKCLKNNVTHFHFTNFPTSKTGHWILCDQDVWSGRCSPFDCGSTCFSPQLRLCNLAQWLHYLLNCCFPMMADLFLGEYARGNQDSVELGRWKVWIYDRRFHARSTFEIVHHAEVAIAWAVNSWLPNSWDCEFNGYIFPSVLSWKRAK